MLLIVKNKNWSTNVFPKYTKAIKKAQEFIDTIEMNGELSDYIYNGNGTKGDYCIVQLCINNITLSVNLNISDGLHRIDSSIKIEELEETFGNYCSYKDLIKKINLIKKNHLKEEKVNNPEFIIITQSNYEGVNRLSKLDCSSKKNLSKDLINFFTYNGKYINDYKTKDFDITNSKNKDIILFFKEKVENSNINEDCGYLYQVFDLNGKEISIPTKF